MLALACTIGKWSHVSDKYIRYYNGTLTIYLFNRALNIYIYIYNHNIYIYMYISIYKYMFFKCIHFKYYIYIVN